MASGNSSRSTTRDDASDDSAATSHTEGSRKENSVADNKKGEVHRVDVENVASLSKRLPRSSEATVAAVSPDSPPKPAKIEANDARMLSLGAVERVSEHPLPASSKGEKKSANVSSADSETDKQWRFLGLSLRSLMLYGLIVAFIAAAFAYAMIFRAGRVLPRKAKRLARLANDTHSAFI
ncbi:hypothetical protein MTO96_007095 [Rhipicephalus appendiculatus]